MTMIPEQQLAQVVVVVNGGCVDDVVADIPFQYTLVDWDNIKMGDARPDLPPGFTWGPSDVVLFSPGSGPATVVPVEEVQEPGEGAVLTVQQVVETAYAWAAVNERDGDIIPVEDLTPEPEFQRGEMGDGLIETILRETMDWKDSGGAKDGPEHWEMAVRRMQNMVRDCEAVLDALYRYDPT